ncbi:MAG: DUF4982 domain-containing protein [Sphingomicrobium sp.]
MVSEYGDWEYYAQNAGLNQSAWADLKEEERTSRQSLGAGEKRLLQQALNIQEAHNSNLTVPAFGDGYWVMFDYNRGYADDLETSGIMSLERLPKLSYWFFRSQRDASERSELYSAGPMVKIASYWQQGSSPQIRVFSNADEVELKLNGHSLGRLKPVRHAMSDHLAHPPFLFEAGRFEPGVVEATAFIGGRAVATDRVETPGPAVRLQIELDDSGAAPQPRDLVFARVRALDVNGRLVPGATGIVRLTGSGRLQLVGSTTAELEGGIASLLVRMSPGVKGFLRAEAKGLAPAALRN